MTKTASLPKLHEYEGIVGKSTLDELRMLAGKLEGKVIQNINSTFTGGGVAEILTRMVPLLNQLGVDARWNIIQGNDEFFQVTKKIHNAFHGKDEKLSDQDFACFIDTSQQNIDKFALQSDIYFIHDPQPVALVEKRKQLGGKWIWRCHIDTSNPDAKAWNFIRNYVIKYDASVFSAPVFSQPLPIRQFLISPSIDPLSSKNKELSHDTIESILHKYQIDPGKPIVLQVSRFDRLKDPLGVIEAFEMVRKNIECQLILAGGTADDDPESDEVLAEVKNRAAGNSDIHILLMPPNSDIEINALQRAAAVIMQKSLKEGFGLTISEALWKAKPIIATAVGGIPLQVKNRLTGLLCYSVEGAAYDLRNLLSNPDYAGWLGKNGKEHVRQNFLITRHLKEYMLLFLALHHASDINYL